MVNVFEGMLLTQDGSGNSAFNAAVKAKKSAEVKKAIVEGTPVELMERVLKQSNDANDPDSNALQAIVAQDDKNTFDAIAKKFPGVTSLQAEKGKKLVDTANTEGATEIAKLIPMYQELANSGIFG